MKKIITALMVLALLNSAMLVGCKNEKPNNQQQQTTEQADVFEVISKSNSATKIVTLTAYKNGNDTLEGDFVTVIVGNDSRFEYNYDRYNTIEEATQLGGERIIKVSGSVIYKNGLYSTDEGKTWGAVAPAVEYLSLELNLDKSKLRDVVVGAEGITFVAKVDKANFLSVLGVDLDAAEATLTVATDGKNLRSVKIDYTTSDGSIAVINTSYTYDTHNISDILK